MLLNKRISSNNIIYIFNFRIHINNNNDNISGFSYHKLCH